MKKTLKTVGIILFLAAIAAYLIITAVGDLTNTGDRHTVHIDGAFEVLSVEHSINGLIPTGTDHYYIGVNGETYEAYLIHGSPSWFGSNFTSDGYCVSAEGMEINSLVKKVDSYDVAKEIASRASGLYFPYGTGSCFELSYQFTAVMKLVLVALIAVLGLWGRYIVTHKGEFNKAVSISYIALLLAAVIIVVVVLR